MNYNTEEEVWKDVKGYEGYYQISDLGRVKSLERTSVFERNGKKVYRKHKEKILKASKDGRGYPKVDLFKDGKGTGISVHRLVALSFITNPKRLPQINHKDENKANNKATNLEWCTANYNLSYNNLRKRGRKKIEKPVIGKNIKDGTILKFPSIKKAERAGHYNVSNVLSGRHRQAKGYIWKYDN